MARSIELARSIRFRWKIHHLFALLWLLSSLAHAAKPEQAAWREARPGDTPQRVLEDFHAGRLENFDPARLRSFPRHRAGSWVVLVPPPRMGSERVLTIQPLVLDAITIHGDGPPQSLKVDSDNTTPGYGRLAWPIPPDDNASAPILLKFEPSERLSAPVAFSVSPVQAFRQQQVHWLILASGSFAIMLAMVLMALCFATTLRDITYVWYAGYIICYVLIQGIQTGFLFQPLGWHGLAAVVLPAGPAVVALAVTFASLFMIRFCELRRHAPLLRIPVMALVSGMPLLVLMRCSGIDLLIDVAQVLLNPLLLIGATLLLVGALVAAVRGSRPAWFFLAGWTPLLLFTGATSAQMGGALPAWSWLNDASLIGGAFEAVVLSLGLADRALRLSHDRDIVRELADHDALTNILNRRAWSERASAMLCNAGNRQLALLFMDLDHFKQLNDNRGHANGDQALAAVATSLTAELRPTDVLGRYGGEEFVALLEGASAEQAMQVATRLCRRVYRLEISCGNDALLSISIGVAVCQRGDDLEALIERADHAMYEAKLHGRNQARLHAETTPPRQPPHLHLVRRRG